MLQIENFTKIYNSRIILRVHNFIIEEGVHWIRGANGSGKSTFLKSVAGIIPFSGDVILNEKLSIKKQSVAYRKVVNFAEAEPVFPGFLTGIELIRLFKSAKNASKNQEDFYLESMNMTSYVNDAVNTYSSGMLKKLSLVLAFLGHPTCIVLDESLTTLDAEAIPVLYSWISNKYRQQGTMFLLSSHQLLEEGILPPVKEIIVEHTTIRHCL